MFINVVWHIFSIKCWNWNNKGIMYVLFLMLKFRFNKLFVWAHHLHIIFVFVYFTEQVSRKKKQKNKKINRCNIIFYMPTITWIFSTHPNCLYIVIDFLSYNWTASDHNLLVNFLEPGKQFKINRERERKKEMKKVYKNIIYQHQ